MRIISQTAAICSCNTSKANRKTAHVVEKQMPQNK